ncbi:MAG: hypothetical protein AABN34_22710 [Acidobacteriota bacterium]
MGRKMLCSISLTLTSILCLMVFQQAALAGPPLICHPFDIGNARSLPSSGSEWRAVDKTYNINRLVEDTLGLLTPETPVLVRMETLRRATVYGVWSLVDRKVGYSVKDAAVARELLSRLKARVPGHLELGVKSDKKTTAIALFDYGYLVESYKQAGDGSQSVKLAGGIDGYGMIVKAIALGGGDPAMEFAAALAKEDRTGGHIAHLQRAAAGAQEGSLLARNLLSHFSNMGKTIGELRANVAKN